MNTTDVTVTRSPAVVLAYAARTEALSLAGGDARRLRPQSDGSVIIVNSPGFDTRSWDRPKRKARKAKP